MEKIKNYRKIKLPDCCVVCKHHGFDYDCYCYCYKHDVYEIVINGLCDDFEREEE